MQSAQLVMKGGVVLALLPRALLARVPGRVCVRHLLREQQREDAKIANESARSHDFLPPAVRVRILDPP